MTEKPLYDQLQFIDLGNGVAEHDNLLRKCLVETQHFSDLLYDRIDLVLGSKGAGKSSLFRMFGEVLEERLLTDWKTIVVSGVETMGEPIFKSYGENFQRFSEAQFETFWKAYLLSLVYNKICHDERSNAIFSPHEPEFSNFKRLYRDLGLIDVGRIGSATKLLKLICSFTVAATEGVNAIWDYEKNQLVFGLHIREKIAEGYKAVVVPDLSKMDTILCIDALVQLTKKSGYKIWMMLDHLDVVFKRRSIEEAKALRALLRVSYAFNSNCVRLKIFLRDDILDAISSDSAEPLAAVSHIGGTGDEGIDGIIKEDRLGLDAVYLQAKRWQGSVGRPEVQKFVGALHGKRAKKGVFITTGKFSADAINYVETIDPKVVLIDGHALAELMIDYSLGTTTTATYQVQKMDSDYFSEE